MSMCGVTTFRNIFTLGKCRAELDITAPFCASPLCTLFFELMKLNGTTTENKEKKKKKTKSPLEHFLVCVILTHRGLVHWH